MELRAGAEGFAAALRRTNAADVRVERNTLSIALENGTSSSSANPILDAPSLVRMLVGMGADIESVASEQVSLEDVYLRLLSDEGRRS
jgi:hypothetical protein